MLSVFWETRVSRRKLALDKFVRALHVDYGVQKEFNKVLCFIHFLAKASRFLRISLSLWHVLSGADLKYPFMVYSAVRTLYYR